MARLHARLSKKGFAPDHVAEVGVWNPELSNVLEYIEEGIRCTLVEPDPEAARKIRERFGDAPHVTLHQVAVFDRSGRVDLFRLAQSTFVAEVESPAVVNEGYVPDPEDRLTVEARTFDEIDDGSIDLLSVDVEGSEWFVLKHMVSRPAVLSLETHGARYVNPHLPRIERWLRTNAYTVWYRTKTDSVFVREGTLPITVRDRLRLRCTDASLALRRARKRITAAFRGG